MIFTSEEKAVNYLENELLDIVADSEILLPKFQDQPTSIHDAINYLIENHSYQITYV